MSTHTEVHAAQDRHVLPDLVRAFALFGICLVNVAYLAWPGTLTYHAGGLESAVDRAADFAVNALFLLKSYTLFSFMFGAGLAYQMLSAQRRGVPFAPEYFRRMLGLAVLGVLHVSFAFFGDILILYALIGCLLYCFRRRRAKTLAWIGGALILFQILITALLAGLLSLAEHFDPEGMQAVAAELQQNADRMLTAFRTSGFVGTIQARWEEWAGFVPTGLLVQGPGVLGFFLLGLAAVQAGLIADPQHGFWRRGRRLGLPLGLIVSGLGACCCAQADGAITSTALGGMALVTLGAPLSSWGYIGLLAMWAARPPSPLRTFFTRAGSASLSAYLLQSILLSLVFAGYGLGLYGELGAAACIAIAVVVALASLAALSGWRARFARGPFEAALRAWTYLSWPKPAPASDIEPRG
jgi:uncharacterized protein